MGAPSLFAQPLNTDTTTSPALDSLPPASETTQNQALPAQKWNIAQLLFSGTLIRNEKKNQTWYIPSLFEFIAPNTVEGMVVNLQTSFTQHLKEGKFYVLRPGLRYGFGNQQLQARLEAQYYYQPSRMALLKGGIGRYASHLNPTNTLGAINNTFFTFVQEENFLKIYGRTFVEVAHSFAPVKNFWWSTKLSWNQRTPWQNLPRYEDDEAFSSNAPENLERPNTAFEEHQALLWETELRWQFDHQMIRRRGELVSVSTYPAISLLYAGSLSGVLGSTQSFQKIALRISQQFQTQRWGSGKFLLESGDFIAKEQLSFVDFKHFNGRRVWYGDFGLGDFQLLDYYQNSTSNFYFQGHYEHLWKPLLQSKRARIQPVISINYLYTSTTSSYWELGIGMNQLLGKLRVDLFNSWREGQHERIGIRFGFVFE